MAFHLTARRAVFAALLLLIGAVPAFAADPVFPVNSHVGLVPPAGFVPSARFNGFENPQASAVIIIFAAPAETYGELEKSFSDEQLKQRGFQIAVREPVTLKDGSGLFVAGPREAEGSKRYEAAMIAKSGKIAALVSVQMIEASHATITDAMLRDSLKTLVARDVIPDAEKLSVLPYRVADLAGFRVIRTAGDGSAVMTLGAKDGASITEQPFLLIGVTPGQEIKAEEREKFARTIFNGAPGIKDVKLVRAEPLRIGRQPGYEIVAEAKDVTSNSDVTTVQWLRFGTQGHMQMFAIANRKNWNEIYPKLRAIRDGIEIGAK